MKNQIKNDLNNIISYPIANTYLGSNTDVDTYFCTGRIVKNRKYFRFFD